LVDGGRGRDAIDVLNQARSINPKAAYCYNALGTAYEANKENDKALDCYKLAAALAPQWALPRLHLAVQYYFARGEKDKAEQEFELAAGLDPRYQYERWMLPAQNYRQEGNYKDAEQSIMDLIRQNPNYASAYIELGLIYEAARQYDKAADAFDNFLRLAPNSPESKSIRERAALNRQMVQKQPKPKQ